MPLLITMRWGEKFMLPVEGYEELKARSVHGEICVVDGNGNIAWFAKNEIGVAVEIDKARYDADVERQKQAAEAKAAEEAKHRAEHEADAKKRDEALAEAQKKHAEDLAKAKAAHEAWLRKPIPWFLNLIGAYKVKG